MTREEYLRLMAMRAEQQRAEYDLEMAKRAVMQDHLRQMEAAKPKKSAIALEAEKGNVIDVEFVEVKPEKALRN